MATNGLVDLVTLVASSVATLCGLWVGIPQSPLDEVSPPMSGDAKLFRQYMRWVDGDASSDCLKRVALSVSAGNPRPSGSVGVKPAYIPTDSERQACTDFAARLWEAHKSNFDSHRTPIALEKQQRTGRLEAIKMFFSFLVSMINPMGWLKRKLNEIDQTIDNKFQSALFGSDSRFIVKSKGSIEDRLQDLDELAQRLPSDKQMAFAVSPGFPELWQNFAAGALTLVDGGERTQIMPPVTVNGQPAVVRSQFACAPHECFDVDPSLGFPPELRHLAPADAVEQAQLGAALAELSKGNQAVGQLAAQESARAREWFGRVGGSYTAQVGAKFQSQVDKLTTELNSTIAQLRLQTAFDESSYARRIKKTSRTLFALLIIAFALIVGAVVVGVLAILAWAIAGAIIGGVFVFWLVTSLIVFVSGQLDLFKELNRRRWLITAQTALVNNLRANSRDLRNTLSAYHQFKLWAKVVTTFVLRPFGDIDEVLGRSERLISGFPPNVQVRELVLQAAEVDRVAAFLRQSFFHVAWLSGPWQAVLDDVKNRLGSTVVGPQWETDEIFTQSGCQNSVLDKWAQRVESDGVGVAALIAVSDRLSKDLAANRDEWQIFAKADVVDAAGEKKDAQGFSDAVAQATVSTGFDTRVLTTEGRTQGLASPDGAPWVRQSSQVLSHVVVRVEMGSGIDAEFLEKRDYPEPPILGQAGNPVLQEPPVTEYRL